LFSSPLAITVAHDRGSRNIISGTTLRRLSVNTGVSNNNIQGNYIGTDSWHGRPSANQTCVSIDQIGGGTNNVVGGTAVGAGNLVSGNTGNGVALMRARCQYCPGKLIGTNAAGTGPLPNQLNGVFN